MFFSTGIDEITIEQIKAQGEEEFLRQVQKNWKQGLIEARRQSELKYPSPKKELESWVCPRKNRKS
ncbi:MAG: hypothetical protein BGO67_10470 [Alphaproteobacteria bacterium 41-28]|nr:MAG: hypothetical protein BGO67_10470 [Alphaproteobacteria bacterium 41-28]